MALRPVSQASLLLTALVCAGAVTLASVGASASAQSASAGATSAPATAESPGPVQVQARADKAEVTVGETFTVEVRASGPAGTSFTFPAEASSESFDLRSVPVAPSGTDVHRYRGMVFALGKVEIPPIAVRFQLPDGSQGETSSAPLEIEVGSLLPKNPEERKLADVRGPVGASVGRVFWIALGAALLLAGVLVYLLLRRRLRAKAPLAPPVPELPPAEEALRGLDALAARGLPARGDYRVFYIELVFLAKRYLERRLGAPVVEMTSAETLAFLRGHRDGGELLPIVRELAEAADRIKFARGDGLAEEAGRHLESVRRMVAALEGRLRPTPAAEGKAA